MTDKVKIETDVTPDVGDGGQTPDVTPTPEPQGDPTPTAAETFTQADLDRIVKERLDREHKKYADYKDLKTKAAELDGIKEAQLSETEKLQKALTEAEDKATKAEAQATSRLIRSSVVAAAARLNFNDPEDAYNLLDLEALTIKEGKVEGVEAAVKALAEKRQYLIKQGAKGLEPFDPSTQGGPVKETDAQKRARIYGGGGGGLFGGGDPVQQGGGVVWPEPKEGGPLIER